MLDPSSFLFQEQENHFFFIKIGARFFPVRSFSQTIKDKKSSSRISKLESTYRKTIDISSLFEQSRASSAIILYKPLF